LSRPSPGAGAASRVLSLLSDPHHVMILAELVEGPSAIVDLRCAIGLPSQTTLRTHLRRLVEIGALERQREPGFAATVTYELTRSGRELQDVADVLARWLAARPGGALPIGSQEAKLAVKALIGGWSINMLRALSVKPLSLTDLDRVIRNVNYPALERRLEAMRQIGLVTATPPNGGRPYDVTDWLRESVAPILASARLDRRLSPGGPELGRLDVETILLLAAPLLRIPDAPDGLCRIEVQLEGAGEVVEVMVAVREGRAETSRATVRDRPRSWLSGTTNAWFRALDRSTLMALRVGGDRKLAEALVAGTGRLIAARSTAMS
jgi:DNA-binding HxlR family transcriptional regulator